MREYLTNPVIRYHLNVKREETVFQCLVELDRLFSCLIPLYHSLSRPSPGLGRKSVPTDGVFPRCQGHLSVGGVGLASGLQGEQSRKHPCLRWRGGGQ